MTKLKPRPVVLQDYEVCAALAGHMCQLRAPTKPQFFVHASLFRHDDRVMCSDGVWCDGHGVQVRCPYGAPGDLLYVREVWCANPAGGYWYRADGEDVVLDGPPRNKDGTVPSAWLSASRMPREACRLWLRVVDVRVERLRKISAADARAEGIAVPNDCARDDRLAIEELVRLWDRRYSRRGLTWAMNPFCWVVAFEIISKPEGA